MATSNNDTSGNKWRWGLVLSLGGALVAGTWTASKIYHEVRDDITATRAIVETLRATTDTLRAGLEKLSLQVESLQEPRPATRAEVATWARSVETDVSSAPALQEVCEGSATTGLQNGMVSIGETVDGELTEADQRLQDDTHLDYWILPVCEAGRITVEMTSSALDSFVFLIQVSPPQTMHANDDGGNGTDARLTAEVSTGFYVIGANSFPAGPSTGPYILSVQR